MAKISYTELYLEIISVLQAVTKYTGITKDEHLHAAPRLGIMTNVASQSVALTLNARPKIQAVGLVTTTADVETSDTVLEFQNLCWGENVCNKQAIANETHLALLGCRYSTFPRDA